MELCKIHYIKNERLSDVQKKKGKVIYKIKFVKKGCERKMF
jgi:hypothetical protein